MRGVPGLLAAALAGLATIVASQDGDADIVPFFVALTVAGGVHAWASTGSPTPRSRAVSRIVAGAWAVAAIWIGVLLIGYQAMCACSSPPRAPEETYLGLTATAYHLVGLYGGLALVLFAEISARREGAADVAD